MLTNSGIIIFKTNESTYGYYINDDVIKLLQKIKPNFKPVIFDVGSNVGQSIELYKKNIPGCIIHAFEPSPVTFEILKEKTKNYSGIIYSKAGVGASGGELMFSENEQSDVSSFLEPTSKLWGKVIAKQMVPIITIDEYVKQENVDKIDFMKIDTQGFDFEVLKGANQTMRDGRITLIQLEITLNDFYKNLPAMDEIIKYLFALDYKLIAFYGFHNNNIAAQWTDGLFIHNSFVKQNNFG